MALIEPQSVTDLREQLKGSGASLADITTQLVAELRRIHSLDNTQPEPWSDWEPFLQELEGGPSCVALCYARYPPDSPQLAACINGCGDGAQPILNLIH